MHFSLRFALSVSIVWLCIAKPLLAESDAQEKQKKDRPTIGLVLAGGGALGFAHVGVLKVLHELRIPVDIVTGTSMGAIIGAAYASGNSIQEMESIVRDTDWDDLFDESPPREDIPYRFKPGRDREILGDAKLAFKDGRMLMPSGVVTGQHVYPLFQKMFSKAPSPVDFDDLPVRFRSVAADIETGEEVVFDSGDLARVVRASMSVPGAFSAVDIEGRYLVDGGIVNNVPIDLAQEMGADILIVVRMHYELAKREDLTTPVAIAGQMINLLTGKNARESVKLLKKKDILIQPDVNGRSAADFPGNINLIEVGEDEARNHLDELRAYSVSEEAFATYEAERLRVRLEEPVIDFVRVDNDSALPDEQLLEGVSHEIGVPLDRGALETDIRSIYNNGQFASVEYQLIEEDGQNGLLITARRKAWLEDYFRFGAAIEDDFEGKSNYRLSLAYRTLVFDSKNAYLDLTGEIGRSPRVRAELYQPLSVFSNWFVAPELAIGREDLRIRNDGEVVAEYQRLVGSGAFRAGYRLGRDGEISTGLRRGFGDLEREVGSETLPEFGYDIGEWYTRLILDSLDDIDFPTEGYLFDLSVTNSSEDLGASDNFDGIKTLVTLPYSWDVHTLALNGEFAYTPDNRPIERAYSVGGFFRLSGYEQNSLLASDMGIVRLLYYRELSRIGNALFGLEIFAGGSVEYARLNSDYQQFPDKELYAGSVFLGMNTPLVPIYFGYGRSDEGEQSLYFALGRLSTPSRE